MWIKIWWLSKILWFKQIKLNFKEIKRLKLRYKVRRFYIKIIGKIKLI